VKTYRWTTWNSNRLLLGDPGQQRHSGSSYNLFWLNKTVRRFHHWNSYLLSFWLALSLLCDVSYWTINENYHDKARVLCLQGSFILVRGTGQFFVRLKLFSKWELSIGLDFKCNVLYKSIASKNIQSDMNYVLKNT